MTGRFFFLAALDRFCGIASSLAYTSRHREAKAVRLTGQRDGLEGFLETFERERRLPANPVKSFSDALGLPPVTPQDIIKFDHGAFFRHLLEQIRREVLGWHYTIDSF